MSEQIKSTSTLETESRRSTPLLSEILACILRGFRGGPLKSTAAQVASLSAQSSQIWATLSLVLYKRAKPGVLTTQLTIKERCESRKSSGYRSGMGTIFVDVASINPI